MFLDFVKINVKSGKGGDGCISFRREKYVPLGGPDGGDGGKGGDVIFIVDNNTSTLINFKYKKNFIASDGKNGQGSNCYGKDGEDLIIKVPKGTLLRDFDSNKLIADLCKDNQKFILLKGGNGGKGNSKFATALRHAPKFAEPGMPASEMTIILELKLIADVGLIGFPNVGKSTLLSVVTRSKPKIGNYPFTTINPNLGVVNYKDISGFVIADIPGIIDGASRGIGLGLDFLKHIERTKILVHIVDLSRIGGRDPVDDFIKINEELKCYNKELSIKEQIIVANKCDMYSDEDFKIFCNELAKLGYHNVHKISSVTRYGIDNLIISIKNVLDSVPKDQYTDFSQNEDLYVFDTKKFEYSIHKQSNDKGKLVYVVSGSFVDRLLSSVNINEYNSLLYFHKVLKNKGVIKDLHNAGIKDGDTVMLNDFEFEFMI